MLKMSKNDAQESGGVFRKRVRPPKHRSSPQLLLMTAAGEAGENTQLAVAAAGLRGGRTHQQGHAPSKDTHTHLIVSSSITAHSLKEKGNCNRTAENGK